MIGSPGHVAVWGVPKVQFALAKNFSTEIFIQNE